MRYPTPLSPGDTVAVTAPSAGVPVELWPRLEFACEVVRDHGYRVRLGECLGGADYVSAPAAERAAELTDFLLDPQVRAIIPPWGGEVGIDVLSLLDWDRIRAADPTWVIGYSDLSTFLMALTVDCDLATVHGNNLMDTPYRVPPGQRSWIDVVTLAEGTSFTQGPSGMHRAPGFDNWTVDPRTRDYPLTVPGTWTRLDSWGGEVDVTGRLIGGCIEAVSNLTGTQYGDLPGFASRYRDDGVIVYLEASEFVAYDIARRVHGMRLAGWFDRATGVLVGRTHAPDSVGLTQHDAVADALGGLGIPIVADVDCGHVPPHLILINGAIAHVRVTADVATITQTLR